MYVIIAGGRDYILTDEDYEFLDSLNIEYVITGGQRGADISAHLWAMQNKIDTRIFRANWKMFKAAAGPIRNKIMAEYLVRLPTEDKAVILFPGGTGTADMKKQAARYGLRIIEHGT